MAEILASDWMGVITLSSVWVYSDHRRPWKLLSPISLDGAPPALVGSVVMGDDPAAAAAVLADWLQDRGRRCSSDTVKLAVAERAVEVARADVFNCGDDCQ